MERNVSDSGNILNSSISKYGVSNFRPPRQNANVFSLGIKPCWVVIERVDIDLERYNKACESNLTLNSTTTHENMSSDSKKEDITICEEFRDNVTLDAGSVLCECCGTPFAHNSDLERHMQEDCSKLNISCEDAPQTDTLIRDNKTPNNTTHDSLSTDNKMTCEDMHDNLSSLCEHCGTPFVQEDDLKKHTQSDCKRFISCKNVQSDGVERKRPASREYFKQTHGSLKRAERAQSSPEVKMKAREDENPEFALFCDFCGKSFLTRVKFLTDIQYHAKYSQLQGVCTDCNIAYSEYYSFNDITSDFTCSRCGMRYKQASWLKNHIRHHARVDLNFDKPKQSVSGNLPSPSQSPLASSNLKERIRRPIVIIQESDDERAPSNADVNMKAANDENAEVALFCDFCGKFFLTKMRYWSETEYYNKYSQLQGICSACNIAYNKYYRFNKKTSDFICKRCGTSYKQASLLKMHILQHAQSNSRSKESVSENLPSTSKSSLTSDDLEKGIARHVVGTKQPLCGNLPSTSLSPLASNDLEDSISRHIIMTEQAFSENLPSILQARLASGNLEKRVTSGSDSQSPSKETNEADFLFAPFFADCEIKVEEEFADLDLFMPPSTSVTNEHTSNEASKVTSASNALSFPYDFQLMNPSTNSDKESDLARAAKEFVAKTRESLIDLSSFENSCALNYGSSINTERGFDIPIIVPTLRTEKNGLDPASFQDFRISNNDTAIDTERDLDPASLVELVMKMDENVTDSDINQGSCISNSDGCDSSYRNYDAILSSYRIKPCFVPVERNKIADSMARSYKRDLTSSIEQLPRTELPIFAENLSFLDMNAGPSHIIHSIFQTNNEEERPQCSECGKYFARSWDCRRHIERIHKIYLPYKDSDVFVCPRCKKPIKYRKAFDNHLIQHVELDKLVHGKNSREYAENLSIPSVLVCYRCGETFKNEVEFRNHRYCTPVTL